jgi:hypothetical protein
MSFSLLSKEFFRAIEEQVGAFDRPFHFRVFPFDAGGDLNFLTVGAGRSEPFVTYISWDLFGQEQQSRGDLGRYELLATCDDKQWCSDVLTKIGRLGLQELFEPGDTIDIAQWVSPDAPIRGIVFENAFSAELLGEHCGLLRCIGVTRPELEFARRQGTPALLERLKRALIYPRTMIHRKESVDLAV